MYEELIGETIDKTDDRFDNFPKHLEGSVYIEGDAQNGWVTKKAPSAKYVKEDALKSITVTTSNGNTFDGDDVARVDMLNAILASETLGLTEHPWKLANNEWVTIQIEELKEASALAIMRKGEILAE